MNVNTKNKMGTSTNKTNHGRVFVFYFIILLAILISYIITRIIFSGDIYNKQWTQIFEVIGLLGFAASALAFAYSAFIFKLSDQQSIEIKNLVDKISDKMVTNKTGLPSVIREIKRFLEMVEKSKSEKSSFYLLTDTLNIGHVHIFNNLIRENYNEITQDVSIIGRTIVSIVEKVDSSYFYYLPKTDGSENSRGNFLYHKYFKPIVDSGDYPECKYATFLKGHTDIENKLIEAQTRGRNVHVKNVSFLPFQALLYIDDSSGKHKALIIFMGMHNLRNIALVKSVLTNDPEIVRGLTEILPNTPQNGIN